MELTTILLVFFSKFACSQLYRTIQPIITTVAPSFGSSEGGSKIVISGANFAQGGMFSTVGVFIGGTSKILKLIRFC